MALGHLGQFIEILFDSKPHKVLPNHILILRYFQDEGKCCGLRRVGRSSGRRSISNWSQIFSESENVKVPGSFRSKTKLHEKNMGLVGRGVPRNCCSALSKILKFSRKQLGFYL